MPRISVVMALYNTPEEYLKKTVESILNQTFNDFEFIIIDDSSPHDYKPFFANYNDERIKYIKYDINQGPGHGRNEGIKISQGEYIAIVDSDDVYVPNRLEIQADFLDKNPDISVVSAAYKYSNKDKVPTVIENDDDIKAALLFDAQIANPLAMFRRKIFADNNLFYTEGLRFAEDYELWLEVLFSGLKMANLQQVLMIYTRRPGQLTKAKTQKQIDGIKAIYKKALTRFGLNPTPEDIEIHYNINVQKLNSLSEEEVLNWFSKLIEQAKINGLCSEKSLTKLMNNILEKMQKYKNRLLKIKIGEYNFCVSKKLRIYVEKRD